MQIKIDVTDWAQEAKQTPVQFEDFDDIIAVMSETAMKPLQAGRIATVLREQGKANKEILPPNKINLQLGAAHYISDRISRQRVEARVGDKQRSVPRYVATATTEPTGTPSDERVFDATAPALSEQGDQSPTLVEYNDPAAKERIMTYLMVQVMGRISERFALLAAAEVDLRPVAEALKGEIDALVKRYSVL